MKQGSTRLGCIRNDLVQSIQDSKIKDQPSSFQLHHARAWSDSQTGPQTGLSHCRRQLWLQQHRYAGKLSAKINLKKNQI